MRIEEGFEVMSSKEGCEVIRSEENCAGHGVRKEVK